MTGKIYHYRAVHLSGSSYSFKGELSPRIGFAWDVLGNGKSKIYGSYARMYERVPNDLAVRSFGSEFGLSRVTFSNADLTAQNGRAQLASSSPTTVADGTRLPFKDDVVLGYQFEIAPQFIVDIKGNWRKQGRVLEDTQSATVESIENLYYNSYIPYCLNCSPGQTELFPGEGYSPFLNYNLANVGDNSVKGFSDVYTGVPSER